MTAEAFGRAGPTTTPTNTPPRGRTPTSVFPVTYRFDPGAADDGVTVHVPLAGARTGDRPTGSIGRCRAFEPTSRGVGADPAQRHPPPADPRRRDDGRGVPTVGGCRRALGGGLVTRVEAVVPRCGCRPRAFDVARVPDHSADHVRGARRHRRDVGNRQETSTRSNANCGRHSARPSPERDSGRGTPRHHQVGRRRPAAPHRHRARWSHGARLPGVARRRRQRLACESSRRPSCRACDARRCEATAVAGRAGRQARGGGASQANRDKLMLARFAPQTAAPLPPIASPRSPIGWSLEHGEVWTAAEFDALVADAVGELPLRSSNRLAPRRPRSSPAPRISRSSWRS